MSNTESTPLIGTEEDWRKAPAKCRFMCADTTAVGTISIWACTGVPRWDAARRLWSGSVGFYLVRAVPITDFPPGYDFIKSLTKRPKQTRRRGSKN